MKYSFQKLEILCFLIGLLFGFRLIPELIQVIIISAFLFYSVIEKKNIFTLVPFIMMLEPIYRSGTNTAYMLFEYVIIVFLIFNTLKYKGKVLKGYSSLLWIWFIIVYLSWLFF